LLDLDNVRNDPGSIAGWIVWRCTRGAVSDDRRPISRQVGLQES
jgi:hypothetical protein